MSDESDRLLRQLTEHADLVAMVGAEEVGVSMPGHPVDGYEAFCRHDHAAPPMVRFYRDWRSAFVWAAADGSWQVRPWWDVAEEGGENVQTYPDFPAALASLAGFDHTRDTPSRRARREADAAIVAYLGATPAWMQRQGRQAPPPGRATG